MARPEQLDPVLTDLAARVREAQVAAGLPEEDTAFERPRQADHGDWATAVALRLAKPAKLPPREIAQRIVDHLRLPEAVESVEVAGPGFVNFRFAHAYYEDLVRRIVAEGEEFGRRTRLPGEVERIDVEFVSANPTGPLHVGHGRRAAEGDAIAALLEADGHEVTREYYFNDAGRQMRLLGESVLRVARGEPLGDDHYHGDYLVELAAEIRAELGDATFEGDDAEVAARLTDAASSRMIGRIRDLLHTLGVDFDVWFSERQLHDSGELERTLKALGESGHTYEQDGALFLRASALGDDKDRVLVRSDGQPTYFAADCAYMADKHARGFDRLLYLLGADHHGYVARLKAVAQALGIAADRIEVPIGQFVNLTRGGEPVKMSKRAGDYVTLDELVEEVGVDVARYHFLRQSLDTTIEFDLARVVEQSMENPVYYVQYAHARIASIVRTADDAGFDAGQPSDADLSLLVHPTELELVRRLSALPEVVAEGAELRAPHRMSRYVEELAGSFHRFYTECRVLQEDPPLARARYWLAVAARQVLRNALSMLRVSAPDRM